LNPITKQKLTLRTAFIAGIFSCIVCIIMLLNYWQLRQSDPLESKLMENLVQQLENDRQNEALKEEIRNLDLMARKAYFTKQWQIRAGGYLLVGSMVVLVFALRIYYSTSSRIAEPDPSDIPLKTELLISRRWILSLIILLFGMALIAAFLSDDHLARSYELVGREPSIEENAVEEITVRTRLEPDPSADIKMDASREVLTDNITDETGTTPTEDEKVREEISESIPGGGTNRTSAPSAEEITRNYPSFRGPFGLGISRHTNIPVDWDGPSGKNIVWKVEVPMQGYNSPVIWDDHLYFTGADQNIQVVYCYNRHSGQQIWQHPVSDIQRPSGNLPKPTDDTGFAAPTVATDGRYIAAIFASGDVVCLNREGSRQWGKNLGIPDNHYGHSSSLILWRDLLLIQYDDNSAGKVMALDIKTGNEKWSTVRKSKISWASPVLVQIGDQFELILSSSPQVAAYNPVTGKEIWAVECLSGEVGPSPAFSDGIVYATNEYATLIAIEPGSPPEILWESNEYLPEVSSPVAADGLLFIGTSYGVIVCYDAGNGDILWEHECDQGIYASPIIVEGKVYVLDMDGKMHIFKKDAVKTLLGEPELGEATVSTPAFADGNLYLRGLENIYCIGSK